MAQRFLSNIKINDAYTFPASDGTSGQVISTDGAGNLSFIDVESEAGATVIYKDNFSGDDSTVTFTLANVVSDEVITQVYIDGVYQNKDTYITSGDQITFSSAPPNGVEIEIISFNTVSTQGIIAYNSKNSTGSTIAAGTAVMAVGTDGNSGHILIAPMIADGSVEPKYFMGITADEVANGEFVDVVHFGVVGKINTNSFTDGDVLWLDPANDGGFTVTEPNAPNIKIASAIVLNASTNGKIFVRVQGNEGLHELHDVHIENLADKDLLVYNTTQGYWENSKTLGDITTGNITTGGTVDGVDISAFKAAYDVHTHVEGDITDFGNYLTNITHDTVNNKLVVTTRDAATFDVDLAQYIDDTNLARLTSGSLDAGTGIATFTRDDATTFTVDFSALFDDTDTNDFLTGASFNTADGVLTLNVSNQSDVTVDLDGRYLESYTETDTLATVTARGNTTSTSITASNLYSNGRLYISSSAPIIELRDTDSTGAGINSFISYKDSGNNERGWIGFGSAGDSIFGIQNTIGDIKLYTNTGVDGNLSVVGNILLTGDATTTNQGRTIDFTGFDKEGTTDFTDRAYIRHTINAGGHSGSVLEISSQNDANDGIAFTTHASSVLKHNGNDIITSATIGSQSVNYASSSGNADTLDGNHGTYFDQRRYTDANNYLGGHYTSGGNEKPNSSTFGAGKLKVAMLGSGNLGFGGPWNDVLWMSTYTGGDVKRSTALVSSKYDNTSLWIVKQNFDSATWGTGYLFWNSGNDGSGSGLDADLLDGVQGSSFLRSDTADTATGMITFSGSTRFPDTNGTVQSMWGIYGWDTQLQFTKRNISTDGFEGVAMFLDYAGLYAQSDYSFRAPIFYDSNNTAWYTDPASRSILNTLQLGGSSSDTSNLKLDVQGNMAIRGGNGLYYGVTTNNYNSWTTRMYASSSTQYFNGQQFIFDNQGYGSTTFATINSQGVSANIFRDSADTNYYLDPASDSRLNNIVDARYNTFSAYRHSGSDFTSGTLVATDIPASATNGASFVIEVTGKSYSTVPPFSFMAQGYLYGGTIINASGVNNGDLRLTYIKVMELNGYLHFWWPRVSYWNSFEVRVRDAGGSPVNRATNVTNNVDPSGATKKVQINLAKSVLYDINSNSGDLYGNIYYDANDTSWYLNPNGYSKVNTLGATNGEVAQGISFRASHEVISGEGWCTAHYAYNENDGFLFLNRDTTAGTARPVFHIGGKNNAGYAGYGANDSIITLAMSDGTKNTGSTYAGRALSNTSYYTNIIKTTTGTVFKDAQSRHDFTGSVYMPFLDIDKTSNYGPGMDLTFSGTGSTGILIRNNTGTTTSAVLFYYSSAPQGARGSITVSSTSTAYNTSSDYRLKENVVPMTGSLERVDQLKPARFNFIGDDKTVDGFLAHEAAEVVPEAVTGTKDEVDEEGNPIYQGIDQAKLVPLLVGAIQELKAEVEALKQQLNGTN